MKLKRNIRDWEKADMKDFKQNIREWSMIISQYSKDADCIRKKLKALISTKKISKEDASDITKKVGKLIHNLNTFCIII